MRRWLRSPVLHFVLIGGALFGVRALPAQRDRAKTERTPVVISAGRIKQMQADFVQRWGTMPTPEQSKALVEETIDEEVLHREARVLALDFQDRSVRRRLLEKMRVVSDGPARSKDELIGQAHSLGLDDDVVIRRLLVEKMRLLLAEDGNATPPTEEELEDYLERHRDRFEQPAELTFAHVFLSASTRGDHLDEDAKALFERLRRQPLDPESAAEFSDPFPIGLRMQAYTWNRVVARFGKPFAERAFAMQPGAWSDPIASPYGLHLLWVREKTVARVPSLTAVRRQVEQSVLAERAAERLTRGLERLRGLYEIRVEDVSTPGTALAARQ